jgi:hypothetical protein
MLVMVLVVVRDLALLLANSAKRTEGGRFGNGLLLAGNNDYAGASGPLTLRRFLVSLTHVHACVRA